MAIWRTGYGRAIKPGGVVAASVLAALLSFGCGTSNTSDGNPDGSGAPDGMAGGLEGAADESEVPDAGIGESSAPSSGTGNSKTLDAGTADSSTLDAGTVNSSTLDAGGADSSGPDAGMGDSSPPDARAPDSSVPDAGAGDSSPPDARAPDSSVLDAGAGDSGEPDGGGGPSCATNVGVAIVDGGSLIPISGTLREIVIDPCNAHVYVSNESLNRIEDYSIATGQLEPPIAVGSQPNGFDVTPDNRRLYVANRGGTNISVVDLAAHSELKKINVPPGFSNDTPISLAIASNGKAVFSTTFAGSGYGGRTMTLDLTSETLSGLTRTTEATFVKASRDRSSVAVVLGDDSGGPVFMYRAATNSLSPERDLNSFVSRVALNADGTLVMVDGVLVLDGSLNQLGTITGGGPWAAFAPSGDVAYRPSTSAIDILSTSRFLVTGSIPGGVDVQGGGTNGNSSGNLAVSSDGKWLAMITDYGITLVNLP